MNTYIVLSGGVLSGGGGAERRFLRVFEKAINDGRQDIRLIINRTLLESAKVLGLLTDEKQVHVFEDAGIPRRGVYYSLAFARFAIKQVTIEKGNTVHLVLIQRSLIPFYLILRILKPFYDICVVATIASYLYAYEIGLSFSEKITYWLVTRSADRIDSLYNNIILQSPKITFTPCSFTDYEAYSPATNKKNIVLFAGRLINEKNPMLFLYAVDELINKRAHATATEWEYVVYGDGPLRMEMLEFVEKNNLSPFVTVQQGDTREVMGEARIFVSLQQHENYPSQSLLEAIATRNVVIATDVGDTRKLIREGYGFLVNLSIKSVADALSHAIDNIELLDEMTTRTLHAVKSVHNIDNFYDYLNELWA